MSTRPTRWSGWAVSCSIRRTNRPASAWTVSWSNRSVAYSTVPAIPAGRPSGSCCSRNSKFRSNLAVSQAGPAISVTRRPGSSKATRSSVSKATMTWNSGWRAGDRGVSRISTRRSKGRSWFSNAARSVFRTRARTSRKVGSPDRSVRSTRVLTKFPTRSCSASSTRPATGVPSGMSVPAPSRESSAASPACTTMNGVTPVLRASSAMRACRGESMTTGAAAPRSSGAPVSAARQYADCRASTLPGSSSAPSSSRCHNV